VLARHAATAPALGLIWPLPPPLSALDRARAPPPPPKRPRALGLVPATAGHSLPSLFEKISQEKWAFALRRGEARLLPPMAMARASFSLEFMRGLASPWPGPYLSSYVRDRQGAGQGWGPSREEP
jgi:hypothetical protein